MCKAISLRRLIIVACLGIGFSTTARNAAAQTPEYKLKASFMCLFGELIKWENDPGVGKSKPLSIGVMGRDPFDVVQANGRGGNYLDEQVATRVGAGKRIAVQRFATPANYQPCHMLFIARDVAQDAQALQAVLNATRGADVLLVTDSTGFARKGATINMVVAQARVQLEINADAAQRASLRVNSDLYRFPGVTVIRD